jgi:hypothetical protein
MRVGQSLEPIYKPAVPAPSVEIPSQAGHECAPHFESANVTIYYWKYTQKAVSRWQNRVSAHSRQEVFTIAAFNAVMCRLNFIAQEVNAWVKLISDPAIPSG